MNEIFLIGKVISEAEFDFIINSKSKSCAIFNIETLNKQIIVIKAYDNIADFAYSKLIIGNVIFVYGKLRENYIEARKINIIQEA